MKTKDLIKEYITPIKYFIDANGSFMITFNKNDLKELLKKYKIKK
jgi:dTDP-4-dehydrorhamnose 3,5-epimerase-like enzyme